MSNRNESTWTNIDTATQSTRRRQFTAQPTYGLACLVRLCAACILLGVTPAVMAQPKSIPIDTVPVNIDSGLVFGTERGAGPKVVYSESVAVDGARWVRLHFGEVTLSGSSARGNASFLRITSLKDGDAQTLDSSALSKWRNTSAYFTGDEVLVELLAYPGTGANRIVVDRIAFGSPGGDPGVSAATICGTDDRVSSTDPRSGRFRFFRNRGPFCELESWCSAFLFNGRPNWILSAGHCCGGLNGASFNCEFGTVVEFNVPASDSDGSLNPSAVVDQYPADGDSVQCAQGGEGGGCAPGGLGNDWCFFGVFDNTLGQTPLERQGILNPSEVVSYRLAQAVPTGDGSDLRITGYGADVAPLGVSNGTQRTDDGPYEELDGTIVKYSVDTMGGSSGSAVEQECRGLVYAIHTSGGCTSTGGENKGTAIDRTELQDALDDPQGVCADCNGNSVADDLDISLGTSDDCNNNGIPDECEPDEDCQPNGTQDICDIASGTSKDRNGDLVPDECEAPVGACCRADVTCVEEHEACCTETGGTYQGNGTKCTPRRTCCVGDGTCVRTSLTCCAAAGGVSQPKRTLACVAGTGVCCLPPTGCCVDNVDEDWCENNANGFFRPSPATCPFNCPMQE